MSFGGHVNDMINRVKQNAALKNAHRNKFKGGNDYSKIKNIKTTYSFPKLSKNELETFKLNLQNDVKKEKIKQLTIWAFVTMLVVVFFLFIFY